MSEGQHEIEFIAKNLPGGIYYYKISAGKQYQMKKMMVN
jgi:hypothetical protein